ncbi:hypothetical protein FisN_7Lh087 [Fistulifera solaris]|uniref:H(+)-exporting diphosphatase n=1 Tax=Fistulifera solaris TaxID=1519565 RepID=A0A1Z5JCJ2_FISSO|nr:hypothetical protein FisN_7Lh087 [Fistulifera solaris]|eukprot:GAX11717.1 hypothetical protein FisN_7Lh087 [Fistulifera solaris]
MLIATVLVSTFFSPSASALSMKMNAAASTPGLLSSIVSFAADVGDNALSRVQWLGSRVAGKEGEFEQSRNRRSSIKSASSAFQVDGIGGSVINNQRRQLLEYQESFAVQNSELPDKYKNYINQNPVKERQVWEALANLEQDMQQLDRLAGQKPQLSMLEFSLLSSAVLTAASGPFLLNGHVTGVLAPSAAALTAAIGIGAEYTGRVAVADGKEIAASCIQCAAEAESFLAQAERAKAITPLCVGIGATAATLALLVPVLLDSLSASVQVTTEVYLFCPLVAILSAAVASLAFEESGSFCRQAIGVGNRRFARSGLVGRSWLSSSEMIERKSRTLSSRWKIFSLSMLPAPVLGSLVPGALPTKTIVVAALAAVQSAYYLARAEGDIARATDAVALKARSAAVCDTYANQGARSSAILPFTSALSGFCAAATAALVELPFLESLAATGTFGSTLLQSVAVAGFPALSALFAAAASVSKARCEVDAEAAMQAASTLALQYEDDDNDPILRPWQGVLELLRLTWKTSILDRVRRFRRGLNLSRRFRVARKRIQRRLNRQKKIYGVFKPAAA